MLSNVILITNNNLRKDLNILTTIYNIDRG